MTAPIVEFDDDGYLRDPAQLAYALAAMDSVAGVTDTGTASGQNQSAHPVIVIVFIHGWHNNADIGNENLRDFNQFARDLQKGLEPNPSGTRVLPLYFAWRGQNSPNPHWYNAYIIPFVAQYLTFFSRKATAERVGRGELTTALASVSQKWHQWRRAKSPLRESYLVIAGHSFGGAALLTATVAQLVAEQETARPRSHLARAQTLGLDAAAPSAKSSSAAADSAAPQAKEAAAALTLRAQLTGARSEQLSESPLAPADLLIAINPAIEASTLDRTLLSGDASFARDGLVPQLLVLDADNDAARGMWFPFGQRVGNLFHVGTPHSEAEREAVGKYRGQVGFELRKDTNPTSSTEAICSRMGGAGHDLYLYRIDNRPCSNSVMVVETRQKIIDGHSGIWGPDNRAFLTQFVAAEHSRFIAGTRQP